MSIQVTQEQLEELQAVMKEAIEIGHKGTRGDYTEIGLAHEALRRMNDVVEED